MRLSASIAAALIILARIAQPPPDRVVEPVQRATVTYASILSAAKAVTQPKRSS